MNVRGIKNIRSLILDGIAAVSQSQRLFFLPPPPLHNLSTQEAAPGGGGNPELTILALPDREVSHGLAGVLLHADGDDLPLQSGRPSHHERLQDERAADEFDSHL